MSTMRIMSAVAVAVAGGLALTLFAPRSADAQVGCDWYANTAVEQQQKNERNKCGFTGPAWSADKAAHLKWCATVPPDQWKKQAQERDVALATKCGKK